MSDTNIHKGSWKSLILSRGKWYIFSSLFTKGLSIFLLPVYTRYLSPADYGMLSLLNSIGQFLPIIISLYIDSAFGRYFHEDKVDHLRLKRLFSTSYWFVAIYGGFVVVVSLASTSLWVGNFAQIPFAYLLLTFIPALLMQLGQLGTIYLRQSLDSRRSTLLEVGAALMSIAITLPLLIFMDMGVMAKLIGSMVSAIFILVYYGRYFYSKDLFEFECDFQVLRRSLIYSLPLLPSVLGGWISGMSDRLILAKYGNLESVGIYSLAATLATLLYVIQDAVTQVTGPVSMSGLVHDRQATLEKMSQLSLLIWALMLTADLGVVLFSPEIIAVFATKKYIEASSLIGICGFVYVVSSQYRIFGDILYVHNKTVIISVAGILMAGVSAGLNLWLIPKFGGLAAAYSFVIATSVYTGWIILWAKHYENVQIFWEKMLILFLIFLGGQWLSTIFKEITMVNVFEKCLLLALFALLALIIVMPAYFNELFEVCNKYLSNRRVRK